VRRIPCDVLYIDPPYTGRQYPANYHILEIIADYHRVEDLDAYEASLYGKTGLRPYQDLRSSYCVAPGAGSADGNALSAMADLILSSRAKHVLVSYSEEGILTREELGSILCRFERKRRFDFRRGMRRVPYKRFRSDSDREHGHARGRRQYKVLEGKGRDEISEWLFYACRARVPGRGARSQRRRGLEVCR
jgi:adenine-specific DNA-methyltransferase